MDVRSYLCSIDNAVLLYEHMVPNVQGEERHTFAELLKRRSDHTATFNDTVTPNSDIGKISSDDTVIHYNSFPIEDDVLTAAKNWLSADFVSWCRLDVFCLII